MMSLMGMLSRRSSRVFTSTVQQVRAWGTLRPEVGVEKVPMTILLRIHSVVGKTDDVDSRHNRGK